jgi:hypothetical protein
MKRFLGNDNYPASTYYWCVTILGKSRMVNEIEVNSHSAIKTDKIKV